MVLLVLTKNDMWLKLGGCDLSMCTWRTRGDSCTSTKSKSQLRQDLGC